MERVAVLEAADVAATLFALGDDHLGSVTDGLERPLHAPDLRPLSDPCILQPLRPARLRGRPVPDHEIDLLLDEDVDVGVGDRPACVAGAVLRVRLRAGV